MAFCSPCYLPGHVTSRPVTRHNTSATLRQVTRHSTSRHVTSGHTPHYVSSRYVRSHATLRLATLRQVTRHITSRQVMSGYTPHYVSSCYVRSHVTPYPVTHITSPHRIARMCMTKSSVGYTPPDHTSSPVDELF